MTQAECGGALYHWRPMSRTVSDSDRCPCTSGESFGECCGPLLAGTRRAATAQALMRSRFTAFAVGDAAYLLASWHPATRPRELDLDESLDWYRLDIHAAGGGTPFEKTGEVTFTAHYRVDGERAKLREHSRFERVDVEWKYLDAL